MEDNRKLKFIRDIAELELDSEVFTNQIRLFSQYLTYSNEDYKYHETYLEKFCQEFARFRKYVQLKNQVFVELCKKIVSGASNLELVLIIDQFWIYATGIGEISNSKNIRERLVCNNKIQIKANLQFAEKEFLFLQEYEVIQDEKLLSDRVDQICNDFIDWIGEITE